jgi:hypothetical protein
MIKMLTATTNQIDDPQAAAAELAAQIKPEHLLKNSVGIISCFYEFSENETLKLISEAFPFDIIGCTAMGSATNKQCGTEQLSLCVLTSEEERFSAVFSEELTKENLPLAIGKVYNDAAAKLAAEANLVFALAPISNEIMGDVVLKNLDKISGGKPIFGTLSNETSPTYEKAKVFFNGQISQNKMAVILIHGNINVRFYCTAISQENIQKQAAVVTKSDGYFLREINNIPLFQYLESIGVNMNGLAAVTTLPFLVDYNDGAKPVALSMYSISEEGGNLGGEVPVGAKILFAEADRESVLATAQATLQQVLEDVKKNGANGVIAIPCFTRCLLLSPNYDEEMKKSMEILGGAVPLYLCYSGGEICPVYDGSGRPVNRFHNFTYTAIVF